MQSDYKPILFDTPKEFSCIEVYILHDLHKGNKLHDERKWNAVKAEILERPNRYAVFVGDAMENAVPGSKSDMFEQVIPPQEQKEWFAEQLTDLSQRAIGIVDGNHERNRSFKNSGLYPLYDCAIMAGIKDLYRPHFAFVDIGVGTRSKDPSQQVHYVGYLVHKAKDIKNFSTADTIEGIDFLVFGHDHDPREHPRAKLVYDTKNKCVTVKSVETIDGGAFLTYGGYACDNAYRPTSDKLYKLILDGGKKRVTSVGFYV